MSRFALGGRSADGRDLVSQRNLMRTTIFPTKHTREHPDLATLYVKP